MKKLRRFFAYRSFWPELETVRRFGEIGINTVAVFPSNTCNSLGEPYSKYPPNWLWFDTYDFEPVKRQFDDLLSANPNAEFLVMLDLNSPLWLTRQLYAVNGDSYANLSEAVSIPRWREATGTYCDALVDFLEEHYGSRIRAYIPACGSTDEWMDLCDGGAGKYKSERYRAWCREKGLPVPDDVPARSRRSRFGFENVLRDPATDAESIRYWRFTSSLVCDTIREFADRVRKRCGREIELGVFYGYILELGGDWVKKGHLAYQELLASGSIDFLISPGTYEHRKIGDGGGFMVPMGTVRRFGRNYLHECDQRTHCFNPNLSRAVRLEFQHWQDEAEDIAGMRREMALSLIHHTSLWWFDMWGGYYQSPAVFDNLARMKELWDRYSGDDSPGRAEIALVVDPDGAALVNDEAAGADRFHRDLCHLLNRVGAPFEAVSFDDLLEPGAAEKYKFLVFASIFELNEERLRRYRERIAGGGRTILWLYAAGISDGIQIQLERNRELAGVPFGTPGLSLTEYDSHRTLYLCRPEELTVPLLRQAVRDAGVHIWTEEEAPVFANARLAAFHTARGGERSLMFPAEVAAVTELFSGRRFELRNHCLAYPFDTPDTVLFELHADSSGPR
ncbi:hypothetical protein FYJ85_10025 [Victivallaceae bacterium BBE-744-WT-12]|uniref:Glycoside hydrolase family 42 N-terminal domain-containing protein n=1 Tax=Victivallis lenta TaxID=2606640 RepID=A0A844G4U0_9BACT|nr:hypothetical protein [Victivallis lenta]MST97379.1 hypothetical protein [Victivallis lenta]